MHDDTQDSFSRRMAADFGKDARGWLLADEDISAARAGRAARTAGRYARLALRNESVAELERQQRESVGLEA